MRIRLPFVGNVSTGKDATVPEPVIVELNPKDDKKKILDVLGGLLQFGTSSLSNNRTISTKLLEANKEWVYRNNDVIAQEVSKMDFELFSVGLSKGEIVFRKVDDSPLLDLLDKFNEDTTKSDGIYVTQSDKKLTGDAFWYLERNGKTIESIYILTPDQVEIEFNDNKTTKGWIKSYKYVETVDNKRQEKTYAREDIIHFKKPNPQNLFRGKGAVEAMAETIDADNLTNLTQINFFRKGAISNFVLTTDSKVTDDQLKRLKAEFRAAYTGAQNAYNTMIFGNGLKPSPVGFSNKEMQYTDLLEWYRDKIMVGFGNTKASLGIIDDVNRASYQVAYTAWLNSTIKPDMDAIVNTLNEFLVPKFGDKLILGYKNPVPEDRTDDVKEASELKKSGIITINEAREMLEFEPVEGGDIFAPDSPSVSTPNTDKPEDQPQVGKPPKPDEGEPEEDKIFRRMRRNKNIPASLAHLNVEQILRKRKMFTARDYNRDLKNAAKPLIRQMLNGKKTAPKTKEEQRKHPQFTNEALDSYYAKQIHTVDVLETKFEGLVKKFIGNIQTMALHNLDTEVTSIRSLKKFVTKQMFNEDALHVAAMLDFAPLLMQELAIAGQEAYRLLDLTDTYIPFNIQDKVKENVLKFTQSMIDTDRQIIIDIITDGINQGSSVSEIRNNITAKFSTYTNTQAERVVRTEVMRASNMGAEDAFIQSGVVEAKQWLIAPNACPICLPYSGKIVGLKEGFYHADNAFQDGRPPVHPSCYDDKTEVLTDKGWMLFKDVSNDQKILSVNLDDGNSEWVSIVGNVAYKFDGKMVKYSNISTDLMVTPDHNQIVRFRSKNKGRIDAGVWQIKPENELPNHDFSFLATVTNYVGVPLTNISLGLLSLDTYDYVRFMAMWLSDGHISRYGDKGDRWQISITCAKNSPTRHEVEQIMSKIFNQIWNGEEKVTVLVRDKSVADYFIKLGKSRTKYIPKELKELDKEFLEEFLDVYSRFDGHIKPGKLWKDYQFSDSAVYFTTSDQLASDLGELILKVGDRPSYVLKPGGPSVHHNGVYTSKPMWVISHNTRTTPNRDGLKKELIDYKGYVYDVELEKYHTLFVRRNGKVLLSGNCRCVLIPIVVGTTAYQPNHTKELAALTDRIAELESKIDKRTKAYKKLQSKRSDEKVYIKSLEKYLDKAGLVVDNS